MNARELRRRFIEFFESKGHLRHDSASLVPIDVTGKLDETLLFTGAGMVQFKPYFRGIAQPPSRRLVNSQKCVRAVDIEEVGNPSHLTFFEMLGNFSFGDYFKKEAIEWAWEFLTSAEWLGLNPDRLAVTVFEEDDEAHDLWMAVLGDESKIHRLGEDKNFWPAGALSNGPPGPCGPCSEIFFLVSPEGLTGDFQTDEEAGRWLEIWNLVFMQFEWKGELRDPERSHLGFVKRGMEPLPMQSIDTGSGLERTAAALGRFSSVYETDVFSPIVSRVCGIANYKLGKDAEKDRAVRIISDHIRTASFCIADGILPSNTGRGYVLRRLIRRCVLKGKRSLGLDKPFLKQVYPAVVEALSDPYVELHDRAEVISTTLRNEEELFRRTMAEGMTRFSDMLEGAIKERVFSGESAFFLHDTYGFPLELTQELAMEAGIHVDYDDFLSHLKSAQERSRAAAGSGDVFGDEEGDVLLAVAKGAQPVTEFLGYDTCMIETRIVQISPRFDKEGKTTGDFQIMLESTPFYPEAGGQVGDTGVIVGREFAFDVTNTWSTMGQIWHDAKLKTSTRGEMTGPSKDEISEILFSGYFFENVTARVDEQRRKDITRNHTATHLLHAALREILGKHVTQAGSLVAPDRLRFDFTHGAAMTPDKIQKVEEMVNEKIREGIEVEVLQNVPISQAREMGAMMLFGEKYGDRVRMIDMRPFSLELCGGIHVRNSGEIGLFKIVSESSSASGVRRIEALTGYGAYEWVKEREELIKEAASALKANPNELPKAAARLQAQIKELRKSQEKTRDVEVSETQVEPTELDGVRLYTQVVKDQDAGKLLVDRLVERDPAGVSLVAATGNGKVTIFCKAGKDAIARGAHAGNLAREVAKLTGGGGGGSPAFAQAGGKDPAKLPAAMDAAANILRGALGL